MLQQSSIWNWAALRFLSLAFLVSREEKTEVGLVTNCLQGDCALDA